jgi:hypothetical protein
MTGRVPNVWAAIIIPVPASALALVLRIKARRMTKMGLGYDDALSIAAWVRKPSAVFFIAAIIIKMLIILFSLCLLLMQFFLSCVSDIPRHFSFTSIDFSQRDYMLLHGSQNRASTRRQN